MRRAGLPRAGPAICSTTAGVRRTPCALMSRRRIGSSIFLGRYRGGSVGERDLIDLNSADLRAFLAQRRAEGLGAASAARELSGVRAFLKYAAEQQGSHAQLPRTRAPRRPRTLPRPGLARRRARARRRCRRRGERAVDWCARPCDPAVALRRRTAGRRSLVANGARPPFGRDPASHRQAGEDAHRSRSSRRCARRSTIMRGNAPIR